MGWMSRVVRWMPLATLTVIGGSLVGCGTGTNSNTACATDSECQGRQTCIDGDCTSSWTTGVDAAESADAASPGADDVEETPDTGGIDMFSAVPDSDSGRSPDSREVDAEDTHVVDVSPLDTGPADRSDADATPDAGISRSLSCNEFYKCGNSLCDRYDYQCRGDYQSRMPASARQARKDFELCMRNNCSGLRGQQRFQCTDEHCSTEWTQCYTHPNGDDALNCSEFRACSNQCYFAEDRTACRRDCQKRAKPKAAERLSAYVDCYEQHCRGKQGSAATECVRTHCKSEFRTCFGC